MSSFFSNRIRLGIIIGIVVIGAIGVLISRPKKQNQRIEAVTKGDVVEAVYGIGTVTANRSYYLKVAVSTAVRDLMVKEGDLVKAGQSLIRFEETTFRAPFSGTITSIQYKVGEIVTPQTTILSLVDMNDRYLIVSLEQLGAIKVRRGQRAMLRFEGLQGKVFESQVESIFSNQGQFIVRVNANSLPEEILPGMTVDVAIEISKKTNVLLAPIAGLKSGSLTVVAGRSQNEVPVKIGLVDGEKFEIESGAIQEGDTVLIQSEGK